MDQQRYCLRAGAAVLAVSAALRLLTGGLWGKPGGAAGPETVAALMYLETGRYVPPEPEVTRESPPPDTRDTRPAEPEPVRLEQGDLERIALDNDTPAEPDTEQLLLQPLTWNLADGQPRVLILHTHGTESYTCGPGESYEPSGDYRTLDPAHNMLSVGEAVAQRLEAAGIGVIHARDIHDYPSFNDSYSNARAAAEVLLRDNPTVQLVLDLHRDAALTPQGQMDTSALIGGREGAELMIVVGTDTGGLEHPRWRENLALGLKLQALLERENPGICRPLALCTQRFNQDESPGALLIEMGAAGNTRAEALITAEALADGVIALAHGALGGSA